MSWIAKMMQDSGETLGHAKRGIKPRHGGLISNYNPRGLRPGKGQGFNADYSHFMEPRKTSAQRSVRHNILSGLI